MTNAAETLTLSGEGGERLEALAFGPKDGRPVLALHGWLDNAATFAELAPRLSGCRVVALDLPGHGHSEPRPPGASYAFIDWLPDVLKAAKHLEWDRFSLLGHSMGAGVASLVAASCPERIERLATVEGLFPLPERDDEAPQRLARHLRLRERLAGKSPTVYPSAKEAWQARAKAGEFEAPESIRPVVERNLKTVEGGVTWRTDPRLTLPSPVRFSGAQVRAFLAALTVPVLTVRARDGMRLGEDEFDFRDMVSQIPDFRAVSVPGKHHVHLERPDAVAAELSPFLGNSA